MRGSTTVEFVTDPAAREAAPAEGRDCAQPWPTYGYDAARTRNACAVHEGRPPFRKLWTVRSGSLLEFPPVVAGRPGLRQPAARPRLRHQRADRQRDLEPPVTSAAPRRRRPSPEVVYVTLMQPLPVPPRAANAARRSIVATRASTGKVLWQFNGAGAVESSPLLVGNLLYFGSWDHNALRARRPRRSKVRWTFEADDELNSSPAYSGGMVFIGSDGGSRLRASTRATGKRALARAVVLALPGRPRVLLRHAGGRLRPRVHRQHRRHDVRLRRDDRPPALGAARRHVRLHGRGGLAEDGLRRLLRRQRLRASTPRTGDLRWKYDARRVDPRRADRRRTGSSTSRPAARAATHGTPLREARARAERSRSNARTGKFVWCVPRRPVLAGRRRLEAALPRRAARGVYGLMPPPKRSPDS